MLRFMMDNFMCSWRNLLSGRVWTSVTNLFSHKDLDHIFFNCFTFYFLGRNVLDMIGSRRFIGLWFACGLVGNAASMLTHAYYKKDVHTHGSSGAINGIMAVLACAAPTSKFLIWGIVPVPAWLVVSGLFGYDMYKTVNNKGTGGVDTAGHIGGTVMGVAYYFALRYRVFR
ncbi:hypothetical protein PM082_005079 [Marasmius tenuissimus]|nr:hypothetical protein PM082_005079 [Marasmius tenuissimus]